jgi:hypothetical protein
LTTGIARAAAEQGLRRLENAHPRTAQKCLGDRPRPPTLSRRDLTAVRIARPQLIPSTPKPTPPHTCKKLRPKRRRPCRPKRKAGSTLATGSGPKSGAGFRTQKRGRRDGAASPKQVGTRRRSQKWGRKTDPESGPENGPRIGAAEKTKSQRCCLAAAESYSARLRRPRTPSAQPDRRLDSKAEHVGISHATPRPPFPPSQNKTWTGRACDAEPAITRRPRATIARPLRWRRFTEPATTTSPRTAPACERCNGALEAKPSQTGPTQLKLQPKQPGGL